MVGILTSTDFARFYLEKCIGWASVGEYMTKPIITITIDDKVRAAAELMVDKHISLLGITSNDKYRKMLGFLSETEIARVTLAFKSKTQRAVSEYIGMIFAKNKSHSERFSEPSFVTIGDIFTPTPTVIEKDADLTLAAKILTSNNSANSASGLPVVESLQDKARQKPVGIISKTDIVRALAEIV